MNSSLKKTKKTIKPKQPIPGFAFCNPVQCNATTTYMRQHGTKIKELFSRDEEENRNSWQTEVLEELIAENKDGFFVTDLDQLQDLTSNLFRQLQAGKHDFIPYLKQIITLSMVPFRKISNGDDRRCFHHIGGFFESLCPIIKLPHPDLQIEAAKAIFWFAQNCGPLNTNENSSFINFYPPTDQIALYSFIPTQLHVESVICTFIQTLTELLSNITQDSSSSDLLSLCFRSLFEFVKRGQSRYIKPEFVNSVKDIIGRYFTEKATNDNKTNTDSDKSKKSKDKKKKDFDESSRSENAKKSQPICTTRVFAHCLLFLDSFIQESPDALQLCGSHQFCATMWSYFVDLLFTSFKNVQKQLRNEILSIIILIIKSSTEIKIEKHLITKMFDLIQSISLLQPDVPVNIAYSTKSSRKIRLTHEQVDIEIIFLAQDLALLLHQKTALPEARNDFISHQVRVLTGPLNKYLEEYKFPLSIHALQLLRSFIINDPNYANKEEYNNNNIGSRSARSNMSKAESSNPNNEYNNAERSISSNNSGNNTNRSNASSKSNNEFPRENSATPSNEAPQSEQTENFESGENESEEDYNIDLLSNSLRTFIEVQGPETLLQLIVDEIDDQTLFYVLLLILHIYFVFKDPYVVNALLDLPRSNFHILSLILSVLAVLMQNKQKTIDVFMERSGIEILKRCFTCNSGEVVISAIDCARSIAPYVLTDIDQRFVFMILDCADGAPTLLRYAFVGLFLDLVKYQPFIDGSLLWKSLKTNANIQKTIVRWWRDEEERLDIRYDKCIIIDIDHPLDGHPLAGHSLKKKTVDKSWLLDRNSLEPPKQAYKLDFRARLYLLLIVFPELRDDECKPTDRIKELMIRSYKELKKGSVWTELRDQLAKEEVKPLHEDKIKIKEKLEKMREKALQIQEEQCDIWQKCENDRIALEQRTYNQLSDGLKTAQFVADNYKQIVNSQPVNVARPYQGRTVKGEEVLVRSGNLRNQQKQDETQNNTEQVDDAAEHERELEETYINDCLQDESISYLVQLMKNSTNA